MPIDDVGLYLDKKYDITLRVEIDGYTFAGELQLSPKHIKLEVYGEITKDMDIPFRSEYDEIVCSNINKTYLLRGITSIQGNSMALSERSGSPWSFKKVFSIEYVIFCPVEPYKNIEFNSINIYSNTIKEWIGSTKKQKEILEQYEHNNGYTSSNEFIQEIKGVGSIGVGYNVTLFSDHFDAGIKLPPSLFLSFHYGQNSKFLIDAYIQLYNLMYLITGGELQIDKIEVSFFDFGFSQGTLYFPAGKIKKRYKHQSILFPLSKENDFYALDLPPFPLESMDTYFNLEEKHLGYINKYITYRRMNNYEDKFLGYFRLLESLTYISKAYLDEELLNEILENSKTYLIKKFRDPKNVKSFIKRIPRLNKSKYNTEKCIQDFFIRISIEIRDKWIFSKSDISSICKLRNDITHANNYNIDELDMMKSTKFIEVLLILKLYDQLGIELSDSEAIIDRVDNYYLLC